MPLAFPPQRQCPSFSTAAARVLAFAPALCGAFSLRHPVAKGRIGNGVSDNEGQEGAEGADTDPADFQWLAFLDAMHPIPTTSSLSVSLNATHRWTSKEDAVSAVVTAGAGEEAGAQEVGDGGDGGKSVRATEDPMGVKKGILSEKERASTGPEVAHGADSVYLVTLDQGGTSGSTAAASAATDSSNVPIVLPAEAAEQRGWQRIVVSNEGAAASAQFVDVNSNKDNVRSSAADGEAAAAAAPAGVATGLSSPKGSRRASARMAGSAEGVSGQRGESGEGDVNRASAGLTSLVGGAPRVNAARVMGSRRRGGDAAASAEAVSAGKRTTDQVGSGRGESFLAGQ